MGFPARVVKQAWLLPVLWKTWESNGVGDTGQGLRAGLSVVPSGTQDKKSCHDPQPTLHWSDRGSRNLLSRQEGLVWGQNKVTGQESQIPGLGRSPGAGHRNPLQNSCMENPHGQRSLVGHSPWGRRVKTPLKGLSAHAWRVRR